MAQGTVITTPSPNDLAFQNLIKSNFNPVAYAQGKWWCAGWAGGGTGPPSNDFVLCRRDALNDWVWPDTSEILEGSASTRPHMMLMESGKLYVGCANNSARDTSWLYTWNGGTSAWDARTSPADPQTAVTNSGLAFQDNNIAICRDASDRIYAFSGTTSGSIKCNYTDNQGESWSGAQATIRDTGDGIANQSSHIDATHFDWGADGQHVGIVFSQQTAGTPANGKWQFGFCKATDTPTTKTNWTFENLADEVTGYPGSSDFAAVCAHRGTGGDKGKVVAFSRDSDGHYWVVERASGISGTWGDWKKWLNTDWEQTPLEFGMQIDKVNSEVYLYGAKSTLGTGSEYVKWTLGSLSGVTTPADLITDDSSTDFDQCHSTYDNFDDSSGAFFFQVQNDWTAAWEHTITITSPAGIIDPSLAGTGSTGIIVPAAAGTGSTGIIVPTAD